VPVPPDSDTNSPQFCRKIGVTFSAGGICRCANNRGYVQLHIEQGPAIFASAPATIRGSRYSRDKFMRISARIPAENRPRSKGFRASRYAPPSLILQ
jgi:hypothetical protein